MDLKKGVVEVEGKESFHSGFDPSFFLWIL